MQFGSFYGTAVLGETTTTPGVAAPQYTMMPMRPMTTTPGVVAQPKAPTDPSTDSGGTTQPPLAAPASAAKTFPWGLVAGGVVALGVVWWLFKD